MTVTLMEPSSHIVGSINGLIVWRYRIKVENDIMKSGKEYMSKAAAEKAGKRVLDNLWSA